MVGWPSYPEPNETLPHSSKRNHGLCVDGGTDSGMGLRRRGWVNRWGQKIDDSKNKARYRVYMSERTDGSNPNTLLVKDADVLKVPPPRPPECISCRE